MLKNTAIAAVLTFSVTAIATVDMINIFVKWNGFVPETKTSVVAYSLNTDNDDILHPGGVVRGNQPADEILAVADELIIDSTNYVDWKDIYRS